MSASAPGLSRSAHKGGLPRLERRDPSKVKERDESKLYEKARVLRAHIAICEPFSEIPPFDES